MGSTKGWWKWCLSSLEWESTSKPSSKRNIQEKNFKDRLFGGKGGINDVSDCVCTVSAHVRTAGKDA